MRLTAVLVATFNLRTLPNTFLEARGKIVLKKASRKLAFNTNTQLSPKPAETLEYWKNVKAFS